MDSKIVNTTRLGDAGLGQKGSVTGATFELEGQTFIAFNGGPSFSFSQGMSLFVSCKTQAEVDEFWEKLSEGGKKGRCGWLEDKFGVSWQIVPTVLGELLSDKDAARSSTVMKAMLGMSKLDIQVLKEAHAHG
jgi:predicted 3-demethylubiquinone-9 3-methyltransferase (glyoxalase superfamily)